jgi:HrpA-like RNA helicase
MLIMASIFNCLDPILTVAACLSYRSPFASPFGMQDEADRAHERFASSMSDHLAALEAYQVISHQSIMYMYVERDISRRRDGVCLSVCLGGRRREAQRRSRTRLQ